MQAMQAVIDKQLAHSSSRAAGRADSHLNSSDLVNNRSALNILMPGSHFAHPKDRKKALGSETTLKHDPLKSKLKNISKDFHKLPKLVQDFNRDVLLGAQDNYEMLLKKQKIDQYIEKYVQNQQQKKL